jgi:hypothetical protein
MSAFILPIAHIDYVVSAAISLLGLPLEAANQLRRTLARENAISVNFRYLGHPDAALDVDSREFRQVEALDPVQVIKAVQSYRYQSCEHPGWGDSRAYLVSEEIREAAIAALPGYESAPCGFESRQEHVDLLVSALTRGRHVSPFDAAVVAAILERFPDIARVEASRTLRTPKSFPRRRFTAIDALKAARAFEKQSSSESAWVNSEASRLCSCVQSSAIAALPGYEEADWVIDDAEMARRES